LSTPRSEKTPRNAGFLPPIRIELMTHGFSVHCSTD
jgi:hypothetical protein